MRLSFTVARRVTAGLFLLGIVAGGRLGVELVRGSSTATTWFGVVPFADPLAAAEVGLASGTWTTDLAVGALTVVAMTLLLGPVFCGWLCPLGLIADLNQSLRRRAAKALRRRGRRLPARSLPRGGRLFALGLVLSASFFAGLPLFQIFSPINAVAWAAVYVVTPAVLGLILLLAVEWVAPRLWCRSLCPLGALHAELGRGARLKVRVDPSRAGRTPCHQCTMHCPMGIRVMEDHALAGKTAVDDPACTRCGSCIDACPGGVLGFTRPSAPETCVATDAA